MKKLHRLQSIHCLGIGGIGVSAIARVLHTLGSRVTGTDVASSVITRALTSEGMHINIGPSRAALLPPDADLVIYSNAIPETNAELKKARRLGIPVLSYPEFLGLFMRRYVPLIVSGTHGKSTTTAMLASIFIAAGEDPTVIVGTHVPQLGANAHVGLGKYCIVEGDEYKAAFHHYLPAGLIINNIEADHLDFYKTETRVVQAFNTLAKKVPAHGIIVALATDPRVVRALRRVRAKVITFGSEVGDYYVAHQEQRGEVTYAQVRGLERFDLELRVPGEHNLRNALAAAVLALSFGISITHVKQGLLSFRGTWRRFEVKGTVHGRTIIDDYAHHPTEIRATLAAARVAFPGRRIWCIFQPHSTHRTKSLFNDFIHAFQNCDTLIVTDIYLVPGRETAERLAMPRMTAAISAVHPDVHYLKTFGHIVRCVVSSSARGDVIITMGAGTITEVSDMLMKKIHS